MSRKEDYTTEEWQILTDAPFLIGMAVSDADLNQGSAYKEFNAILVTCGNAEEEYQENELIQHVINDIGGIMADEDESEIKEEKQRDPLYHFEKVVEVLDKKSPPEEADQFKRFLYDIGVKVAEAYREGMFGIKDFLHIGKKISDQEKETLKKLRDRLGIDAAVPDR